MKLIKTNYLLLKYNYSNFLRHISSAIGLLASSIVKTVNIYFRPFWMKKRTNKYLKSSIRLPPSSPRIHPHRSYFPNKTLDHFSSKVFIFIIFCLLFHFGSIIQTWNQIFPLSFFSSCLYLLDYKRELALKKGRKYTLFVRSVRLRK